MMERLLPACSLAALVSVLPLSPARLAALAPRHGTAAAQEPAGGALLTPAGEAIVTPEPEPGWRLAAVADFDGDGDPDLVWQHPGLGRNQVWLLNGTARTGTAELAAEADPEWTIVAAADFDGNGRPDLLWRHLSSGEARIWLLDSVTLLGETALDAEPDVLWRLAAAGDLDGDGHADLVWRHLSTGRNRVWLMDGAARVGEAELEAEPDPGWEIASLGRFGPDAHSDVLWRDASSGRGRVWLMEGLQHVATVELGPGPEPSADWRLAAAADFNGDGHDDVLWSHAVTGAGRVRFMDGEAGQALSTGTSGPTPAATGDALTAGASGQPPLADTGGPYRWSTGEPIQFDGTRSSDPDGQIVRYVWSFGDGSPDAEGPRPTRAYGFAGRYAVTLTVTDNDGVSVSASTTAAISVFATFDVAWAKPVGVAVDGNNLTKTGPYLLEGSAESHQQLVAGNGYVGWIASETTTRRVAGLSGPGDEPRGTRVDFGLELGPGGDLRVLEGGLPTGFVGSYQTGDRLRVFVASGVVFYVKNGQVLGYSSVDPTYPLALAARLFTSGATLTGATAAGEHVEIRNDPPTVSMQAVGCHVPCVATFTALAHDPDRDPLTYSWSGCASGQSGRTATCPLPAVGTVAAAVVVRDPFGAEATASGTAAGTNAPPQLALAGDTFCHPACVANFTATASDPDGDSLRLTWGGCAAGQSGATASCSFPALEGPSAHAVVGMLSTSFAVLDTYASGCSSPAAVDTATCRAAAHRFCAAQPGYVGGFGPVEYTADVAVVVCVTDDFGALPTSSFAELATHHPGCSSPAAAMSLACSAATNRYCRAKGYGSGFGPVEYTAEVALPFCAQTGGVRVLSTTFAELHGQFEGCTSAVAASSACRVASNRYCRAYGYGGGFGPVEASGEAAQVACLPPSIYTASASVSVTADDDRGGVVTRQATIALRNSPPGLTVTAQPTTCHIPCTATFTARASDPDGDPLSMQWSGCAAGQSGATVTCPMATAGTYIAGVTVRDPGGMETYTAAQAVGTNLPPTVTVTGDRSCHPPCSARFRATANDPDGDPLELVWGGCAVGQAGTEAVCAFTGLPGDPPPIPMPGASLLQTTFAVLNGYTAGCNSPAAATGPLCRAASNRFCAAQAGYAGGYGPVEYTETVAYVVCLGNEFAAQASSTFAELAAFHAGCASAGAGHTSACATAVHRLCVARGYGSGVGPQEYLSGPPVAVCAEAGVARQVDTTFEELRTHFPDCFPGADTPALCRTAVNRFCRAKGYGGGFGPTEYTENAATVTCLPGVSMRSLAQASVTADDGRGGLASAQATVRIANGTPSGLVINATPTSCVVPCTFTFTAAAADPDGDALVFAWDGCAVGQAGPSATCAVIAAGPVTASVVATDGRGGEVSLAREVTALPADPTQNLPPVADAGGPYQGVATLPLAVDGRRSRDPEGRPLQYAWDFGDGGTATGATASHAYATAGTRTLTLTVTDDRGATASATTPVTVGTLNDPDGDGLTNLQEHFLGTNPQKADTNGDGVPDGAAVALGLSPIHPDMDGDGLGNVAEIAARTDPFKADTDGDGVSDSLDRFPLDPTRQNPAPIPGDQTPPAIQLVKPERATPIP